MLILIDKLYLLRISSEKGRTTYKPLLGMIKDMNGSKSETVLYSIGGVYHYDLYKLADMVNEYLNERMDEGDIFYSFPEENFGQSVGDFNKWPKDMTSIIDDTMGFALKIVGEAMLNAEDVEEYTRAGNLITARVIKSGVATKYTVYTSDVLDELRMMTKSYNKDVIEFLFADRTHNFMSHAKLFKKDEQRKVRQDYYYVIRLNKKDAEEKDLFFVSPPRGELETISSAYSARAMKFPDEESALNIAFSMPSTIFESGFEVVKVDRPTNLYLKRENEYKVFLYE